MKRSYYLSFALLPTLLGSCDQEADASRKYDSALSHFRESNYLAAEIELKNTLAADPRHKQARKTLGIIWARQGAGLEAARMLADAKRDLPDDNELGVAFASALVGAGATAEGRKEILDVLERDPHHRDALLLLAETSFTPEQLDEASGFVAAAMAEAKAAALLAGALIELRRGDVAAGRSAVEEVLRSAPGSAQALALLAQIEQREGQPERALARMAEASAAASSYDSEPVAHAVMLARAGQTGAAEKKLREIAEKTPDYLPVWRVLASLAAGQGDDEAAEAHLRKVLARNPLDLEACLLQAEIRLRASKPTDAVALMERVASIYGGLPGVQTLLGRAHLANHDFPRAGAAIERALATGPTAGALLLRCQLHLAEGRPAEAARDAEALIAEAPTHQAARNLLVEAYIAAGRPEEAIAALEQQTAASPADPTRQMKLAHLLAATGKPAEAREAAEQARDLAPDAPGPVALLAFLDEQAGRRAEAMTGIEDFLLDHPDSGAGHQVKARLLIGRGELAAAEPALLKAIELDDGDLVAHDLLIRLQLIGGRTEDAAKRLESLVADQPENTGIRIQLGTLLMESGAIDEARQHLEEVVRLAPQSAAGYNNLAHIDSELRGEPQAALAHARKARALDPHHPSVADTLGWIELQLGNHQEALTLLRQAADGLPRSPSVQFHLGMAHYMNFQQPQAAEFLGKALELEEPFQQREEAERRLGILRDVDEWDLAMLQQRSKEDPADVVLLVRLGDELSAAGQAEEAAAAYQAAIAVNSELEAAHVGAVEVQLAAMKNPTAALELAVAARKALPRSAPVAAALGQVHFALGNHPEAHSLFSEAARAMPADPKVRQLAAEAAYAVGRVAEAREHFAQLPEPIHNSRKIREVLALSEPGAAASAEAIPLARQRLEADPDDVVSLMLLAAADGTAKSEAEAMYRRALEVYPSFFPARLELARLLLQTAPPSVDEAEALLGPLRIVHQDEPELNGLLGLVGYHRGNFPSAILLLGELSTHRALKPGEQLALAMSFAETGDPVRAGKELENAIASGLREADAKIAREKLESLAKAAAQDE